ncbi:alpha-hydroxy-acid oxidizing protein [Streptomyces sp. PTM05]|uniref:Alpha-hydroxy-acid oxidizing protein n=1 Tax=Streptantibioticus parmotrematis TaxID=2873249 RepID=A0ABS7R0R8_9ACTN|nr:alpha-hydroxy acid oxidase [Streptantibioticus parmotrematis]MBY8889061.1 alpha-hydroxy-acid oxidizing protein [Streptantibioticus parmotrematis]
MTATTVGRPLTIEEYAPLARARLPEATWHYFEGGAGTESTVEANRAAFRRVRIRPRVLSDVSHCDTSTTILGEPASAPLGVAPMAYHELACEEGEVATVRAAGELRVPTVVGIFASRSFERIAEHATGPVWLQLYWLHRRGVLERVVRRAEDAGFRALVLTVDTPRLGRRLREARHGFHLPPHITAPNLDGEVTGFLHEHEDGSSALSRHADAFIDPSLNWSDLDWLRSRTRLPIVLKGVLSAADAARAADLGVDALIVSNHGGRQLDGASATLDALPDVVRAVAGRCPVFLDGGVRGGTDVLKALAAGARAVFVGRPVLWGLAAAGEAGARDVLTLLRDELEDAMALAGCPSLDSLTPDLLDRGAAAVAPAASYDESPEGRR